MSVSVQDERLSRESVEQSQLSLKSECETLQQQLNDAQQQTADLMEQLNTSQQVHFFVVTHAGCIAAAWSRLFSRVCLSVCLSVL